jgi:hypothetical protein
MKAANRAAKQAGQMLKFSPLLRFELVDSRERRARLDDLAIDIGGASTRKVK